MEKIINIHVKKLPEGVYLATSQDVQGLVAQGRTATEALGKMGTSYISNVKHIFFLIDISNI